MANLSCQYKRQKFDVCNVCHKSKQIWCETQPKQITNEPNQGRMRQTVFKSMWLSKNKLRKMSPRAPYLDWHSESRGHEYSTSQVSEQETMRLINKNEETMWLGDENVIESYKTIYMGPTVNTTNIFCSLNGLNQTPFKSSVSMLSLGDTDINTAKLESGHTTKWAMACSEHSGTADCRHRISISCS